MKGRLVVEIISPADLAKHALANISLGYAQSFIPLVRHHIGEETGAAAYGAVCGYYTRPFTNNRGFGRLSLKFVPSELMSLHEKVLRDRHKIFMHSDIDVEINGVMVNNLEFVSDSQQVTIHNIFLCPNEDFLANVEDLIRRVKESLQTAINNCLNDGPPSKSPFPAGTYYLNLNDSDTWFIPAQ